MWLELDTFFCILVLHTIFFLLTLSDMRFLKNFACGELWGLRSKTYVSLFKVFDTPDNGEPGASYRIIKGC